MLGTPIVIFETGGGGAWSGREGAGKEKEEEKEGGEGGEGGPNPRGEGDPKNMRWSRKQQNMLYQCWDICCGICCERVRSGSGACAERMWSGCGADVERMWSVRE